MINRLLVQQRVIKTSVQLMELAQKLNSLGGVVMALAMQGTLANCKLLAESGFELKGDFEIGPSDLVIAISAQDEQALAKAETIAQELLGASASSAASKASAKAVVNSLDSAIAKMPKANLALISLPGEQAVAAARQALQKSLHVHLFSDNVPLAAELALKQEALAKGLLMMGPGCGTAIINQVPLGFANIVKKGSAGLVSAAGTGLQELSCLLSRQGVGISQAIGVGGRDLSLEIGGLMMLAALEALESDAETEVIALISKPPHPEVLAKVAARAASCSKPVVLCLLGGSLPEGLNLAFASTIEGAALEVKKIITGKEGSKMQALAWQKLVDETKQQAALRAASQKWLRGFYVGGTMCFEALCLLRQETNLPLHSNLCFEGVDKLPDSSRSVQNTLVDFGEEEFTLGRVHPMIDPSLRHLRILQEANDPEVAVLLLDFVLGLSSHPDPVGAILPTLAQARKISEEAQRHLTIIAAVVGTDQDPQNRRYSVARLKDMGVIVADSNAQASRLARLAINEGGGLCE